MHKSERKQESKCLCVCYKENVKYIYCSVTVATSGKSTELKCCTSVLFQKFTAKIMISQ